MNYVLIVELIGKFLVAMKDQTFENAASQEERATPKSKSPQYSSSFSLFRHKRHSLPPSSPTKPSPSVFLPLSPEQRKQLEALFPALLVVERLLEAELCPGNPALCETHTVLLQKPFQASSLSLRRRIHLS